MLNRQRDTSFIQQKEDVSEYLLALLSISGGFFVAAYVVLRAFHSNMDTANHLEESREGFKRKKTRLAMSDLLFMLVMSA